ncbi:MAG: hypothetical protein WEC37_00325 [Anaerolineales bacterium]
MYWFREGSSLSLLPWLVAMLGLWLGGWLLATHAFRLSTRERLIVGLGLGLVLYTWLANILGHWLPPSAAFIGAAVLLLFVGMFFAWRRKEGPWLHREDLAIWPWLVIGVGLVWLFLMWGKGLALFDEHKNLSLISVIANGDIPPRFMPNYPLNFIYHYGFQVFGASLMQLGGMLPWSAFDTAKAVLWGETMLLGALLGFRYIGRAWGGLVTAGVLALASGTRYLLLLLPPSFLLYANRFIELQGTSALIGKPFSEALISGWPVDGGPTLPYMFGFLNGIIEPMVMAHQGPNTFSVLILLLVWLLLPKLTTRWSALILAAVLSMWALAWETSYVLFLLALFLFAAITWWRERFLALPDFKPILVAGLLSIPIVLLQGGTFTEMARDLIFGIEQPGLFGGIVQVAHVGAGFSLTTALPAPNLDILGFGFRWPPAILSSHLGGLSLFSPSELLVGLFEIGPVLLFTPWITAWAWRRGRAGDWPLAVLMLAGWLGFLIPLFMQYEADRDISRLTWQALLTWTLMLTFVVSDQAFRWRRPVLRNAAIAGLGLMAFGGLVIAGSQFSVLSTTQLAHNYNELDAAISAEIWGKIPTDAEVFGPLGSSTVLSGHLTGQLLGEAHPSSRWNELILAPSLNALLEHGYEFFYIDSRWWDNLSPEVQAAAGLDAACVETFAEVWDNSHVNFRRLLDLRLCVP